METINFLGIHFRSHSHLSYFLITVFILIFNIFFYRFRINDTPKMVRKMSLAQCLSYIFIALMAINETNFGHDNGPVYSADCIWYNCLQAIIYLIIYFKIKKRTALSTS